MDAVSKPAAAQRLPVEIAHILFLDLVGYSRLTMEEQAAHVEELQQVVQSTDEFQAAEAREELICLDSGDGMALVFFRDPAAPVQCAIEIAQSLRVRTHVRVRMGINSGPVSRRPKDIRGQANVSGTGINMAQRVMDCGDAGHILLSHQSAEVLGEFARWSPHLRDLGECEVKHGTRLHLYNLYIDQVGNPTFPRKIASPSAVPAAAPDAGRADREDAGESVTGAVPLGSRFYLARPSDDALTSAIDRREGMILIKGARQMGKTSLLARGLQRAREIGARAVSTDLQMLNQSELETGDALFLALSSALAEQLDLDVVPRKIWDADLGANMNMERFLRRHVFPAIDGPLVWGLDEVDRLFATPTSSEAFGLFRSWYNRRSLEPAGPWSRLTMVITYATEAHLFISDLNQSPFNIGIRLHLEDFSVDQVAELNRRYGEPLMDRDEVERFQRLVGGQPYLVRRGLADLASRATGLAGLEADAEQDDGPYGDHLRRVLISVSNADAYVDAVRAVLRGAPCPSKDLFYHLRAAGVLRGGGAADAQVRCPLYARYLDRHLP